MKNVRCRTGSLVLAFTLYATTAAATQPISNAERDHAVAYLNETRDGVLDAVKGLSDAQWNFKPAPDRWSIAEVVEHLALLEHLLTSDILPNVEKAPVSTEKRDAKQVDEMILTRVPDRSTKLKAPPSITPTDEWSGQEALHRFVNSRTDTIAILKSTPDLRDHILLHPALGPMDGYQWVLAAAAHSARHTKQILEVKADPNFPAK